MSSVGPGFRFACTRCGHCCSGGSGHVWIEEREIAPPAEALGMSAARFVEWHVRRVDGRLSLREVANEGGRRALLIGKNTCAVYAARPEHCRRFPYWESALADPAADAPCCLERDPDALFATGMEADHALERRGEPDAAAPRCRLGAGRPLACRTARAGLDPEACERLHQRLRALE